MFTEHNNRSWAESTLFLSDPYCINRCMYQSDTPSSTSTSIQTRRVRVLNKKLDAVDRRLMELFDSLENCKDPFLRFKIEDDIDFWLPKQTKYSEELNRLPCKAKRTGKTYGFVKKKARKKRTKSTA